MQHLPAERHWCVKVKLCKKMQSFFFTFLSLFCFVLPQNNLCLSFIHNVNCFCCFSNLMLVLSSNFKVKISNCVSVWFLHLKQWNSEILIISVTFFVNYFFTCILCEPNKMKKLMLFWNVKQYFLCIRVCVCINVNIFMFVDVLIVRFDVSLSNVGYYTF